jgi:hypothetical protein
MRDVLYFDSTRRKALTIRDLQGRRKTKQTEDAKSTVYTSILTYPPNPGSTDQNSYIFQLPWMHYHITRQQLGSNTTEPTSRIIACENASPQISALFYKATIQTVLLYRSETWVVTNKILQLLTSFHHRIARRLAGRYPRPIHETDEWNYPSIQKTLQIAGLFQMEEYLK